MIDISNDLCGTIKVDGETIKVVKVGVMHVLTTQDEPVNIKQCSCGGFYLDEDCFCEVNHTITKAGKESVSYGFNICGGISWDAAVFNLERAVLSLIPEEDSGKTDSPDEADES